MARQNRTNKQADEQQAPAPTEENKVTESTAEGTAPENKPDEAPVDLTAYKAAVEAALTEADSTTGAVPEASVGKVNDEYRKIEGNKGKREARDFLESSMLEAVGQLDAVKARSYSDLRANLSAGGGSSTPKAPADPTAAFVQRVAALRLALSLVETSVGENVAEDWSAQADKLIGESAESVAAYQAWAANEAEDKGDAPEVSPMVRSAFKLSTGKASGGGRTSGGSGVRRDIGKHITSAFAEVEVGTFLTIAEIAKHKSAEYGDDSPSQGAISARLFPTTTVEGIEPVEKGAIDGKNPKGARKVA